ncbi:MAG: hypothetical protein LCH81_19305 [Bacteroidetes bacterium]|nr:hypothetical protein [Bacteroidota bacterium]
MITYLLLLIVLFYFFIGIGKKFLFIEFLCIIPVLQWLWGFTIAIQTGFLTESTVSMAYFYLLSGTLFYIIGLCFPYGFGKINTRFSDSQILNFVSLKLKGDYKKTQTQFLIGITSLILTDFAPISLKFIFQLLGSYFFIATIKFIISDYKGKWVFISMSLLFIIEMTLLQGMLGTIVFWAASSFLLLNIRVKINALKIIPILSLCFYLMLILYSAKTEYRAETWHIRTNAMGREGKREIRSSPERLGQLIIERINNPSLIFKQSSLVNMVQRVNQAFQVILVMKRVPDTEPFADGEMTIYRPFISLVPRIIWPDKPLIPDPADYKRFTGIGLTKYNSVTIGPIGEAYADFGKLGVIYLFFYGLLIRIFYKYFRLQSEQNPYMIIWFLIIMSGAISHTETTISGAINGYLKFFGFALIFTKVDFYRHTTK